LQYGPEVKSGEPIFFMVNMFDNSKDKQIRMRHVDCDFIIQRDGIELFNMSSKYGEPFFTQLMELCYHPSDLANQAII
jgi:hypothetical protein